MDGYRSWKGCFIPSMEAEMCIKEAVAHETAGIAELVVPILYERRWDKSTFSERSGLTYKEVEQLLENRLRITPEIAGKLEQSLGHSAEFWLDLESERVLK